MVFITKKNAKQSGLPIVALLSRSPVPGEVGLEIEVEGNKFPKPPNWQNAMSGIGMPGLPGWSFCKDGSLRGQDNAEYVLTNPIGFDEVPEKMEALWKAMTDYGTVLSESNRTSVHVHLNAQGFHLNRLASFMALWFCFEEVLTEWCGEYRVGNLFCLRGKDAPAIVKYARDFIKSDAQTNLGEQLHYGGLNVNALFKFGSLEIRTLPGVDSPQRVVEWVNILRRLYDMSKEFSDPREICSLFSMHGPMAFFEKILGDTADVVRQGISFDGDQVKDSMYEGIRMAQDICFCREWDDYKPEEYKPDPFGRPKKKMSSSQLLGVESLDPEYEHPAGSGTVAVQSAIPVSLSAYTAAWSTQQLDNFFAQPSSLSFLEEN